MLTFDLATPTRLVAKACQQISWQVTIHTKSSKVVSHETALLYSSNGLQGHRLFFVVAFMEN